MRITLGAIREILDDYNKQQNRTLVITDEIVHNIKQEFEETKDIGKFTPEEFVVEIYEELLCDCEHEDYCVEEDSEDRYNGQGDYIRTDEYQYKVCNICGATCPILGVERTAEDEYDEICGDWER